MCVFLTEAIVFHVIVAMVILCYILIFLVFSHLFLYRHFPCPPSSPKNLCVALEIQCNNGAVFVAGKVICLFLLLCSLNHKRTFSQTGDTQCFLAFSKHAALFQLTLLHSDLILFLWFTVYRLRWMFLYDCMLSLVYEELNPEEFLQCSAVCLPLQKFNQDLNFYHSFSFYCPLDLIAGAYWSLLHGTHFLLFNNKKIYI